MSRRLNRKFSWESNPSELKRLSQSRFIEHLDWDYESVDNPGVDIGLEDCIPYEEFDIGGNLVDFDDV